MIRQASAAAVVLVALVGCQADDSLPSRTDATTTVRPPRAETAPETEPAETANPPRSSPETSDEDTTTTAGEATTGAPPPYALAPTRRCLIAEGAGVSAIGSSDERLRELGDLAQQTSLEIRVDGETVGLAIGNAELLQSLLRSPDDRYRLEVRRNALLMYRSAASSAAALVRDCLR